MVVSVLLKFLAVDVHTIGDNCGSESSTLETDVCVWRYAPLVVHATQEEEEEDIHTCCVWW